MNILMIETREKLQKECDNLNLFKEILSTSNKKTKEMCSILSKFDERLSKLEDTIAPVYEETGNLQRKQANIVKSIENLDYVIRYYNIASQVDSTVNAGPNIVNETNLIEYLDTLDRLQDAIKYFESNNPDSVVLKDIRELYDKGSDNVLREFKQLLYRHTKPLTPVKVYELVHEEEMENSKKKNLNQPNKNGKNSKMVEKKVIVHEPLDEKVEKTFKLLTNWLCTNRLESFIVLYAEYKSSILVRSVAGLKNHLKSSTNSNTIQNSPMFARKNYQPQLKESSSNNRLTPKGIQQALKKKFQDVLLTDANLSSKFHGTHFLSPNAEQKDPPLINEKEIVCYLTSVTAFYKLAKMELQFIESIIPAAHKEIILSKVVLSTLNDIVDEGNSLANRVKRFSQKHDFTLALNLFPILRHQVSMQAKFDQLFYGCTVEVQQKLKGLIAVLQTTINRTLEEFIEFIREDNDTKVPRDGTVHELTSNIMVFVAQLNQYIDILNRVISLPDTQCIENTSDTNRSNMAYAQYIFRVLQALSCTLNKKGQSYSDPYLKAIFMLNNYHYILKSLRKTNLLEIVHLYNHTIETFYEEQILENKRIYSQSWSRVLNYVFELDPNTKPQLEGGAVSTLANMRLKDKDKRYIKDKFAGFNKEVEEIKLKQKNYAIPDVELCNKLKKDNKEFIIPKYAQFYHRYCYLDFTRNPQKYLKYTPENFGQIIDTFFDSTA